jgi:hypothetical protein
MRANPTPAAWANEGEWVKTSNFLKNKCFQTLKTPTLQEDTGTGRNSKFSKN